jgi:hypothetical protein
LVDGAKRKFDSLSIGKIESCVIVTVALAAASKIIVIILGLLLC